MLARIEGRHKASGGNALRAAVLGANDGLVSNLSLSMGVEAERSLRVAKIRLNTLVPGAPLRYGVEATRRLRAADAELEAARVAYETAQDLPAPED